MIPPNNVGMIVYPKLAGRHECNRRLPGAQVFTVFADEQILAVEKIGINTVHDARCSVIGIWSGLAVDFLHRNTPAVEVFSELTERNYAPTFTPHTPTPSGSP